jgi:hypothetical protein
VPASNVNDGINAVRRMLDQSWIDEVNCEPGLNALRSYRRDWSDKLQTFRDAPLHNAASHGADALKTFAEGNRDPKEKTPVHIPLPSFDVRSPAERGTGWLGR